MEGAKAGKQLRFSSTQWGILLNRNLSSSLHTLGSDLQLHRNIRQNMKSVKNIQGFPLHYGVTLPASLFQSCSQRRSPSHHAWYKHFLPLPLHLSLWQCCTPGSVLSHTTAAKEAQSSLVSKSLRLPELWWAEHQRAPRAKHLMPLWCSNQGRGNSSTWTSTKAAVNTLKSSEQFPSHSVDRREVLQPHCQLFIAVLPHYFTCELGTKHNLCLNAWWLKNIASIFKPVKFPWQKATHLCHVYCSGR